jgi:phosphatidylglycerophosphate synthase
MRVRPFFRALLISILIEVAVLVVTGGALASSMMRHSALAPRTPGEDFLAGFAIVFHFPSLLITAPLGLFLFAPLVQVALMTCVIGLFIRARRNAGGPPRAVLK